MTEQQPPDRPLWGSPLTVVWGNKVCIADGWADAGREGIVVGRQFFSGQWWCPIVWPDEDDPDLHKSAGLKRITRQVKVTT